MISLNFIRGYKAVLDAHGICMKVKAIARSSGALAALPFGLKHLNHPEIRAKRSQPVLLNTLLSALSRQQLKREFWELVEERLITSSSKNLWSFELAATILNQLALEGGSLERAFQFYRHARLTDISSKEEPNHLNNALLKCLSRNPDCSRLIGVLDWMSGGELLGKAVVDVSKLGIKPEFPVELVDLPKPVMKFDCQSVTSVMHTIARASDGTIQLAEALWTWFGSLGVEMDAEAYLSLLLVYRNDLQRLLSTQKLHRDESWRKRKLNRVCQLIKESGAQLNKDVKFLSVYFEICLNARMAGAVREYCREAGITGHPDERIDACIKRAQIKNNQ